MSDMSLAEAALWASYEAYAYAAFEACVSDQLQQTNKEEDNGRASETVKREDGCDRQQDR